MYVLLSDSVLFVWYLSFIHSFHQRILLLCPTNCLYLSYILFFPLYYHQFNLHHQTFSFFSNLPSFLSPLDRFRNLQQLSPTSSSSSSSPSSSSFSRSLCIGHYSSGLEGVSRADRLELRGAFDSLYAYLAEELSSSSAGTHYTMFHNTTSYHIISHHITSHHTTSNTIRYTASHRVEC